MSRTNCLRPSKGFCLNLRVLIVNSDIDLLVTKDAIRQQGEVRFNRNSLE